MLFICLLVDEAVVLLPPCKAEQPTPSLMTSICAAIATRIDGYTSDVRKYLKFAVIEQWGKIRRVDSEEGDTMRAASLSNEQDDKRDATFVRVSLIIDLDLV